MKRLFIFAGVIAMLLAIGGCSSLGTTGAATDQASDTDIAVANTTMQVALMASTLGAVDCSAPAPAPSCTPATKGETKGAVQQQAVACLSTIAISGVVKTVQARLCRGVAGAVAGTPAAALVPLVPPK